MRKSSKLQTADFHITYWAITKKNNLAKGPKKFEWKKGAITKNPSSFLFCSSLILNLLKEGWAIPSLPSCCGFFHRIDGSIIATGKISKDDYILHFTYKFNQD